jgi:hypothetical protein
MSQLGLSQVRSLIIDNSANALALTVVAGPLLMTQVVAAKGGAIIRVPCGQSNFNLQCSTASAPGSNVKINFVICNYEEAPAEWSPVDQVYMQGGTVAVTSGGVLSVAQSGAWTISSGTVNATCSGAVSISSGNVTVGGAVSISSGNVTVGGTVAISSGTITATVANATIAVTGASGVDGSGLQLQPNLEGSIRYTNYATLPIYPAYSALVSPYNFPQLRKILLHANSHNTDCIYVQQYSTPLAGWCYISELRPGEWFEWGSGDAIPYESLQFSSASGAQQIKVNIWH